MIYGLIFDYHCILVRYRSLVLFKEFGSIVHKIFSKKGLTTVLLIIVVLWKITISIELWKEYIIKRCELLSKNKKLI